MRPSFITYFGTRARPVKLIDKRQSWLMRAIAWFLGVGNKLGLCDIDDFMGRYVTTIGARVYAIPAWTTDMVPSAMVIHELTHVLLWSFLYAIRYIYSPHWRLMAEADCIQATMLCFVQYRTDAYCRKQARSLVGYGIDEQEALLELLRRLDAVQSRLTHRIPKAVKEMHQIYSTWECHA